MERLMANFFCRLVGMGRFTGLRGNACATGQRRVGLGFRRLKEYNRAMLVKLAWRVVRQPNNTLHQVLRQR
ncbi:UNVERIFIED_CONTAM: hypothetical protein Sradi_5745700 [Sesamum radiatum]|uniref:Uncharacterized protein n=1 Tax=Sesamum radiatum TaxID=300843 RepID=A0AAW2L4E4_SESRA